MRAACLRTADATPPPAPCRPARRDSPRPRHRRGRGPRSAVPTPVGEAPRAGLLHRSGRRRRLDRRGPGLRDRVRRAYSRASDPAAPVVPVRLRAPGQLEVAHTEGKIDTGSDLCAVPEPTIAALNLPA